MILATIFSIEAKELGSNNVKSPYCKDLGVYGETFPIHEKSLLEMIKAKLQALSHSGTLEQHQQIMLKKAKEQLNRPAPVKGVSKTVTPKSFTYDPTITVPYDLKDFEGTIFHTKGTILNPLDTKSFNHPLLFVDGDDSDQVGWAIQEHQAADPLKKPKIILIKGAPFELSKALNLPIYFDQSGVLVKKFGITQVPAIVSQKGKILLVDEVNPTIAGVP